MKTIQRMSLSVLCGMLFFQTEKAPAAVIDLFTEGPQSLILDTGESSGYLKENLALSQSALSKREVFISGRGQSSLGIDNVEGILAYSVGVGESSSGSFDLRYTAPETSPANLVRNGENSFRLRFEELHLSAPVNFSLFYYSTQWKGYVFLTLPDGRSSVELLIPFSDFGVPKTGDFSMIRDILLDFRSFAPGDSLKLTSFTTVPEQTSPAFCAAVAAFLLSRRRRA